MNRIQKHNRLLKKLFINLLIKTKLNLKGYYITFRQANNTEIDIHDDLKIIKIRYSKKQVNYITKHYLCNYYNNRGKKLYKYLKHNHKRARHYAILHELGHLYHYQKKGFAEFLNEYKSEKIADNFALKYIKKFKV